MPASIRSGWLFAVLLLCPALALGTLSGCASLDGGKVEVATQLKKSVLLEQLSPDKRVVYIIIHNKTNIPNINVKPRMEKVFEARGYRITKNRRDAHYEIEATLLHIGPSDPTIAAAIFNKGYGTPVYADAMGMGDADAESATTGSFFLLNLLGGVTSTLQDWVSVKTSFVIIADLRISEYADDGSSDEKIHYTTRMMSTARGMDLELRDALASLRGAFINTVGDIFRGS